MSDTKQIKKSDWTGSIAIIWIMSFLAMCGYTVIYFDLPTLEKIVALLGAPTLLVLKFYFDKVDSQ